MAALIPYCTRNTEADAILTEHAKKLKEVLSYIDAHYMEELTISGLAGICFFSEYYFMRFFKKYMGMSCVQYIKNVRLERAADQFENGETNTLEVALACGFSNLSYFHREFKKKYGMTPKRFISLSARAADFHEIVNNYHFYDS
ncbi:MAG: helix-turn-helix transcriptional regulator [Roseburia inulinivorans]